MMNNSGEGQPLIDTRLKQVQQDALDAAWDVAYAIGGQELADEIMEASERLGCPVPGSLVYKTLSDLHPDAEIAMADRYFAISEQRDQAERRRQKFERRDRVKQYVFDLIANSSPFTKKLYQITHRTRQSD